MAFTQETFDRFKELYGDSTKLTDTILFLHGKGHAAGLDALRDKNGFLIKSKLNTEEGRKVYMDAFEAAVDLDKNMKKMKVDMPGVDSAYADNFKWISRLGLTKAQLKGQLENYTEQWIQYQPNLSRQAADRAAEQFNGVPSELINEEDFGDISDLIFKPEERSHIKFRNANDAYTALTNYVDRQTELERLPFYE